MATDTKDNRMEDEKDKIAKDEKSKQDSADRDVQAGLDANRRKEGSGTMDERSPAARHDAEHPARTS